MESPEQWDELEFLRHNTMTSRVSERGYRKELKPVMGSARSSRNRTRFAPEPPSSGHASEAADVKVEEPTVCVYFPDEHENLTPKAFKFHLFACAHRYLNQMHRFGLPVETVKCRYCFEKFFEQESWYHAVHCEKRKAAKLEEQALKDQKLVEFRTVDAEKKDMAIKGHEAPNPVAEDEDWDAEDVVPRNMTGGPICAFNPFRKVDKSPVIVIPIGKTKSERRHLIEKRVELFTKKKETEYDFASPDW